MCCLGVGELAEDLVVGLKHARQIISTRALFQVFLLLRGVITHLRHRGNAIGDVVFDVCVGLIDVVAWLLRIEVHLAMPDRRC